MRCWIKVIPAARLNSDHVQTHLCVMRSMGAREVTLPDGSIAIGFPADGEKPLPVRKYPNEWWLGEWEPLVAGNASTH